MKKLVALLLSVACVCGTTAIHAQKASDLLKAGTPSGVGSGSNNSTNSQKNQAKPSEGSASLFSSSANDAKAFTETFDDNTNQWYIGSANGAKTYIKYGKYYIDVAEFSGTGTWNTSITAAIAENKAYTFSAELVKAKGNTDAWYGIMWGHENMQNTFFYMINAEGKFLVGMRKADSWTYLIDQTTTPALNNDNFAVNTLEVKNSNGYWLFYINGRQVGKTAAQPFFGNKIGVLVNNQLAIQVENIKIAY